MVDYLLCLLLYKPGLNLYTSWYRNELYPYVCPSDLGAIAPGRGPSQRGGRGEELELRAVVVGVPNLCFQLGRTQCRFDVP